MLMEEFLKKSQVFFDQFKLPSGHPRSVSQVSQEFYFRVEYSIEPGCSAIISDVCQVAYALENYKTFICAGDSNGLLDIDKIELKTNGIFMKRDEKGNLCLRRDIKLSDYTWRTIIVDGKENIIKTTNTNGYFTKDSTVVCLNTMEDIFRVNRFDYDILLTNRTEYTITPRVFIRLMYFPCTIERLYFMDYECSPTEQQRLFTEFNSKYFTDDSPMCSCDACTRVQEKLRADKQEPVKKKTFWQSLFS